jgi:hypothetical protein
MLTYTQACTLRGYEEQCEMLLERLGRVIESYEARRDPLIVEGKKRRKKNKKNRKIVQEAVDAVARGVCGLGFTCCV